MVFYLQVPADARRLAVRTAVAALAPGGTFLLVGHDLLNLDEGWGGPQDPVVLTTAEGVLDDLAHVELELDLELVIERAERVERVVATDDGRAHRDRHARAGPPRRRRAGVGGRHRGRGVRTARVIPCLDVDAGRVVKGVNFVGLRDAGDPVELAARYDAEGADELVFLDITASSDQRETIVDVVRRTAEQVFIPFTIGGGIRTVDDARRLLRAGADKVSVNTAAVDRPELIAEIAAEFGNQCVVVAIDARRSTRPLTVIRQIGWEVYTHGGRTPTGLDVIELGPPGRVARRRRDPAHLHGSRRHPRRLRHRLTSAVADAVGVPVIASGGVGTLDHLVEGVTEGGPTPCWRRRSSTSASTRCTRPRPT